MTLVSERDHVDEMLEEFATELPFLDLEVEGIVERIQSLTKYQRHQMEETLQQFGLTHGEWAVLGMLKRTRPPHRRTPGVLTRYAGISSGAMTNRLDRLEEAGLVRRVRDEDDRRSVQVELTEAGHRAWEEAVAAQGEKEATVAATLSEREKEQLNRLLRKLVLAFERAEERR